MLIMFVTVSFHERYLLKLPLQQRNVVKLPHCRVVKVTVKEDVAVMCNGCSREFLRIWFINTCYLLLA
jgi:hypothetical protein